MANSAVHKETTFHVGDSVDVHYRLIEKEKVAGKAKKEVKEEVRERIQIFSGIVINIRGEAENKSFTVRRIGAAGIGIERIFPLTSPWVRKVAVKKKGSVRRAKLFYLRNKLGKEGERLKEKVMTKSEKQDYQDSKTVKKEIPQKEAGMGENEPQK